MLLYLYLQTQVTQIIHNLICIKELEKSFFRFNKLCLNLARVISILVIKETPIHINNYFHIKKNISKSD